MKETVMQKVSKKLKLCLYLSLSSAVMAVILMSISVFTSYDTGVNYLENNQMLVSGEFIEKTEFAAYQKTVIPEEEAYAANCIWVNGTVIVPEGYPAVNAAVAKWAYP